MSGYVFSTGERVLASGSVQLPRFTLLESGSLLISPSHLSDAGTYTCMASNSRGIDEASADLVVWGECVCVCVLKCIDHRIISLYFMMSMFKCVCMFVCIFLCIYWCAFPLFFLTARTRITNPPQDQSVIKGTKATMTCGVTHDPSVSVRCSPHTLDCK